MKIKNNRKFVQNFMRDKTGKPVTRRDILNIREKMRKQSVGDNPQTGASGSKSETSAYDPVCRGEAALPEGIDEKSKDSIVKPGTERRCPQSDCAESDGSDFDVSEPGFDVGQWLNDNFEGDDGNDRDIQVNIGLCVLVYTTL